MIRLGILVTFSSKAKRQLMIDESNFYLFCQNVGYNRFDAYNIIKAAKKSKHSAIKIAKLCFYYNIDTNAINALSI